MRKTIKHYHFTLQGKNILCAAEYENHLKKYDVTIWCDNRLISREKMQTISWKELNRLIKPRITGLLSESSRHREKSNS